MRLALQRLLADSDALRYLRSVLNVFNGATNHPFPGQCLDCRRRLRGARIRTSSGFSKPSTNCRSIDAALERDGAGFNENKINSIRAKSQSRASRTDGFKAIGNSSLSRGLDSGEQDLWRLLNDSQYRYDFSIWLELAHTRRRVYGVEGIRLVWKAMIERDVNLPTGGALADDLWHHFLELGFRDNLFLKGIFVEARKQKESHNTSWRKLYYTVLSFHLRERPGRAWLCHIRLYKHFQPTSQQFRELFGFVLHDEKLRQIYLSMHKDFSSMRIYDATIPELCRQGLFATAVKWHKALIERRDLPSSAIIAEPVMQYLAATGEKNRLLEYSRLMVAAGVSFSSHKSQDYFVPSLISREILGVKPRVTEDEPEPGFSDQFCARLFATKVFSVDNIINALAFLGTTDIGPLALREMAARDLHQNPYHRAIRHRLTQLQDAGISLDDSHFSTLVRKLAFQEQSNILSNVISCDLHPETFEDYRLQESLLPSYQEQRDTVAFNRTIAILTLKVPERHVDEKRWNLILRSYLTRRDFQSVRNTIERMQDLQIQLEPWSITYMSQTMLSRRQIGRRPTDTKELDLLVRVWQDVLRSGGLVPPYVWTEILRRLGMSGRLHIFERLSLFLTSWYTLPRYRTLSSSLLSRNDPGTALLQPSMSIELKTSNPLHPLHRIFSPSLQQAIVAWGFQHGLPIHKLGVAHRRRPEWSWGLLLLRKLRDNDVHVSRLVVTKAFKLRMVALFGPRKSRRKINRINRYRNSATLESYVGKAREIWGPDLFKQRTNLLTCRYKGLIPNELESQSGLEVACR
ncbi:MAG: hypothetical protein Q9222_007523 [Ikaeria aurantiellina]